MSFPRSTPNTLRTPGLSASLAPASLTSPLVGSFLWMTIGLLLSAGSAAFLLASPSLMAAARESFLFIFLGQLALVAVISFGINKLSSGMALALFLLYAISNGPFFAILAQTYTGASIVSAFGAGAATFAGAALYGFTTKRDMSGMGMLLTMALFGLIGAMLINAFLLPTSGPLNLVISIVGVLIFTGLTAYDLNLLRSGKYAWITQKSSVSVFFALALYLDLINLVILFLRLFGQRK